MQLRRWLYRCWIHPQHFPVFDCRFDPFVHFCATVVRKRDQGFGLRMLVEDRALGEGLEIVVTPQIYVAFVAQDHARGIVAGELGVERKPSVSKNVRLRDRSATGRLVKTFRARWVGITVVSF